MRLRASLRSCLRLPGLGRTPARPRHGCQLATEATFSLTTLLDPPGCIVTP